MKIFSTRQIFDIEEKTFQFLKVDQEFLMEKASEAIVSYISKFIQEKKVSSKKILIISGKGNNGGDGFLSASKLSSLGLKVDVLALHSLEESSFFNKKYRNSFSSKGTVWEYFEDIEIDFSSYGIIVDAILGIGFKLSNKVYLYQKIIEKINTTSSLIISLDTPSGLDLDEGLFYEDAVVRADITLGLGLPKLGYFLDQSKDLLGELHLLPLPFPKEVVEIFSTKYHLLTHKNVSFYLPKHSLSAHKYDKGMVIGFGGKKGMKGALALSCLASLYTGSGIVVGVSPQGSGFSLDTLPYEVIKVETSFNEDNESLKKFFEKAKSLFLGPGLGTISCFSEFMERIIKASKLPVVLDADALNMYAQQPFLLPDQCIFTPHIGEMKRILNIKKDISLTELIHLTWEFAKAKNIVVVLKGATTFILSKEKIFVSAQGDVRLATAGSGDILTGIIASLLSQGLGMKEAACLGVYTHSLLAKRAFNKFKSHCFKAGDFLPYISTVLQEFQEKNHNSFVL